ncbi:MAG: hypothetical protein ABTR27_09375, partial [Candidatus Competibacter phosphatis]
LSTFNRSEIVKIEIRLSIPQEQPETTLEPRNGTTGELFKGPMVWIGLVLGFFQGSWVIACLFLPHHRPQG